MKATVYWVVLALGSLAGPALGEPPQVSSSSTPASVGHPAPVWRYDGEDYYLVDRASAPGRKELVFLRDGDSPEKCNRRLIIRKEAAKDLRAFEKSYVRTWDQAQRDVVYRSPQKLVHSGWLQKGELLQWKVMHWELQGGAVVCTEFELLSRPPTADRKSMEGLVGRQVDSWRKQLASMMKQAPGLLAVP